MERLCALSFSRNISPTATMMTRGSGESFSQRLRAAIEAAGWELAERFARERPDAVVHLMSIAEWDVYPSRQSIEPPELAFFLDDDTSLVKITSSLTGEIFEQQYPGGDVSTSERFQPIVRQWLEDIERHSTGQRVTIIDELRQSVERLTGLVRVLADDRDRLHDLLERANARNRDLEMELERYGELLDAWARFGAAVARGHVVNKQEAATFSGGLARTLRDMTVGGIVGNRTDAGVVWAARELWPELQPFAELITDIITRTGGVTPI